VVARRFDAVLVRNLNVVLFEVYVEMYFSNASVVSSHSLLVCCSAFDDVCGIFWWFCVTS